MCSLAFDGCVLVMGRMVMGEFEEWGGGGGGVSSKELNLSLVLGLWNRRNTTNNNAPDMRLLCRILSLRLLCRISIIEAVVQNFYH